ncbi:FecR family protein [Steroidobacter sp.]|uniref:FecR family protein n=1 Tax=Steroidobacter sp. TaxID=1978227 RepID=UPI001A3B1AC2|nr:FecR domain-containing protein [Steroidobacter sp.]MBL8268768.1 FecR domain-containing protein [Steroidobacter sp.]
MTGVKEKSLQEAELWFARRRDVAVREAEQESFDAWCSSDAQNASSYAEVERLWGQLAVIQGSQRLRALIEEDQRPPVEQAARFRRTFTRPAVLWLGLCAGIVAVSVALLFPRGEPDRVFTTAVGEQRTEMLSDGSTLRLNTNSSVKVRMTSRRREVDLESGEAAFDVAKEPARPFVVNAADGAVTAVGTRFLVNTSEHKVAVTLLEGRVRIDRESRREVEQLVPGQQAVYDAGASGILRRNVDVAAVSSWLSGRLEFRGVALAAAVDEANRYSTRKVRIGDPRINQVSVSGSFRTGDVEAMVAAFEALFPLRAQREEHEIVLFCRGSSLNAGTR